MILEMKRKGVIKIRTGEQNVMCVGPAYATELLMQVPAILA